MEPVLIPDIAIAGAGIIGLSVALELHLRGASVLIVDTARATGGATTAAAGMLAAEDPHNPPELRPISRWSLSLYDTFLDRVQTLSGMAVPYQTTTTIQYLDNGTTLSLAEKSIDPRQLAASALEAVRRSGIPLLEDCDRIEITEQTTSVELRPQQGRRLVAGRLVHASGAWFVAKPAGKTTITPRKGQMLRVQMPPGLDLREVHRGSSIYAVPRTQGPQAGTVLIGATDEDAGFDLHVSQSTLNDLRTRAAALVPALGSSIDAPQIEAWAGLRPATPDLLPAIGPLPATARQWIAGAHYRNGILLAPATATALADMLEGKPPALDMQPFDPGRLA